MTPREPDRYEAKAREVTLACRHVGTAEVCNSCVAAALRAVEAETLERAAQALDSHRYINASKIVRALASPAAAPAAEKVTPELLAAHAADLAAGRHDLNGAYGCSICGTSPSEPAAPAPDFFADHSDAEVQAALDDVRGKPAAPAPSAAEKRIAELETQIGVLRRVRAELEQERGEINQALKAEMEDAVTAHKRIAELEGLLRHAAQYVAWRMVEDKRAEALFARIDAALAARAATQSGEPR